MVKFKHLIVDPWEFLEDKRVVGDSFALTPETVNNSTLIQRIELALS